MGNTKKIIILCLAIIIIICYWLLHLTEGVYYKTYSPYGEYSIYASKYKYYKYLNLNFPSSRFGDAPGRIYLYDEIDKKVISSCNAGMISLIGDIEVFDTYLSDRGGPIYLELPKPFKKEIIPIGYEKITETYGDLDGDNLDEKVIIFNTNKILNSKKIRMLQILKHTQGKWVLWKKSAYAVMPSTIEKTISRRLLDIKIENGALQIKQKDTEKENWRKIDTYRFINNEFLLVAYKTYFGRTSKNYFKNNVQFNLETGKINFKRDSLHFKKQGIISFQSKIMEEIFYRKKIHITLQNRYLKEIKITSPKNQFLFIL